MEKQTRNKEEPRRSDPTRQGAQAGQGLLLILTTILMGTGLLLTQTKAQGRLDIGYPPLLSETLVLLAKVLLISVNLFLVSFILFVLLIRLLNRFFDRYTGGKQGPAFFDIQKTCPELLELERNYKVIREELEAVLPRKQKMPKYHELDLLQYKISATEEREKNWSVFLLYVAGRKPKLNRQLCPRTCALVDKIPNLFQAQFSILDAGKSIPKHSGPYRGYLRYHLGLKVPEKNPPTIRVKDQYYTWKEGESVLFTDSLEDEVYNNSDDIRAVLIVDILRPMPPLPHAINVMVQPLIGFYYAWVILGVSGIVRKLSHLSSRRVQGVRRQAS
jgi:hypothetical protein